MKKLSTILSIITLIALLMTVLAACTPGTTTAGTTTATTAGTTAATTAATTTEGTTSQATETTAPAGDELEAATLRVWAHWGSEQRRPSVNKMVEGFNAMYADKGLKAEYVFVPFGDLETKLIASVTAGNPPNAAVTAIEDEIGRAHV